MGMGLLPSTVARWRALANVRPQWVPPPPPPHAAWMPTGLIPRFAARCEETRLAAAAVAAATAASARTQQASVVKRAATRPEAGVVAAAAPPSPEAVRAARAASQRRETVSLAALQLALAAYWHLGLFWVPPQRGNTGRSDYGGQ
ncbi:hypothetical protein PHYPSEUDO_004664 [Phytophthora pseudosyringae]|uniref:Uncharacterized protein n=1 Tax=Phytophthora pseudosyringae TaxID=221518 RepID=A0A8T1VRG2_9STRA|nr:hypothetical protein PHYPSEUDO_004664 [Phytophthora pseudosyringae]